MAEECGFDTPLTMIDVSMIAYVSCNHFDKQTERGLPSTLSLTLEQPDKRWADLFSMQRRKAGDEQVLAIMLCARHWTTTDDLV